MAAPKSPATVPVGAATACTGLSADTLRYYERQGLLPPVARSVGGQRRYTQIDLDRLSFLLALRETGMSIATMRQFAALRRQGEAGRPARLSMLLRHREAVRARLDLLHLNLHAVDLKITRHRRVLRQQGAQLVSDTCNPTGDMADCALMPIHHVQLAIPRGGEPQSRSFWAGVLRMRELEKPPVLAARGGCWFRGGDLEVHLGVEEPFAPALKAHPGLLVDGLPTLARHLEQAGYLVTWDGEFPATTGSTAPTPSATGSSSSSPRTGDHLVSAGGPAPVAEPVELDVVSAASWLECTPS